jgi:hypothetical protein
MQKVQPKSKRFSRGVSRLIILRIICSRRKITDCGFREISCPSGLLGSLA